MYNEGLLAVRAKLKGGKMRYVPIPPELADELRQFTPQPANNVLYIAGNNHERIFPKKDAKGERQRVEGSFDDLLERAGLKDFRFMICAKSLWFLSYSIQNCHSQSRNLRTSERGENKLAYN
jgi:hypothetical protein